MRDNYITLAIKKIGIMKLIGGKMCLVVILATL